jgi:hypothetical protein
MAVSNEDRCKDCKRNPGMGCDPGPVCEGCEISYYDFTLIFTNKDDPEDRIALDERLCN